jgi:hypothetical protein
VTLIEVTVRVRADEVWEHLRRPELVRRWFGWDYDGLDAEIELIFGEQAIVEEEGRAVRWEHGDRFELVPDGDATLLRLTRRGQPESGFDEIAEGWIAFVQQLRFALSRHPGAERHTLHLPTPTAPSEADVLALGEPWYATEHQAGVVIGDALLVVARKPDGGATLTLSAYASGEGGIRTLGRG